MPEFEILNQTQICWSSHSLARTEIQCCFKVLSCACCRRTNSLPCSKCCRAAQGGGHLWWHCTAVACSQEERSTITICWNYWASDPGWLLPQAAWPVPGPAAWAHVAAVPTGCPSVPLNWISECCRFLCRLWAFQQPNTHPDSSDIWYCLLPPPCYLCSTLQTSPSAQTQKKGWPRLQNCEHEAWTTTRGSEHMDGIGWRNVTNETH